MKVLFVMLANSFSQVILVFSRYSSGTRTFWVEICWCLNSSEMSRFFLPLKIV